MNEQVKKAIQQYNMIRNSSGVIVALSGGADSVALLHVMLDLQSQLGIRVEACHVNHNLRSTESAGDEAFVRDLCGSLDVKLHLRSVDVRAMQKKHHSVEETAREARYAFFEEISDSELLIATAHTASDNAETVLLNLIRGTGLKGLCGIPPVRGHIIRPLLFCGRTDIENFCDERGLSYVTDSTNSSVEYTRNKIRLLLLPIIREINPSFDGTVTRMCENLRQDENFIAENGNFKLLCEHSSHTSHSTPIEQLRELEKPLQSRIIVELLTNNNISPSNLKVMQITEMVMSYSENRGDGRKNKSKINLEKHKFAVIEDGVLRIKTIQQEYR